MDETTRTQFQTTLSTGFKRIVGANGQVSVIGMDGEKVSFNVSEETAQAFTRDQAKVRAEAIQETFSNSQGLDYLTNVSKQLGVSEAYSFLNDARQVRAATESYGVNVETVLVRDYALNHYGDESPENIRRSMSYLNHLAMNDPNRLNTMIDSFVSGSGYGRGSTAGAVNSAINATKNRVHDDAILKGGIDHTTGTASQNTSGIISDNLVPPDHNQLRDPDSSRVDRKADHLRDGNRYEETGQGNVRTSAAGMASEGVGKVLEGVVDSQGMRPTEEGAFDYVHPVKNPLGVDLGDPRPIPKDAPSTIGGKK